MRANVNQGQLQRLIDHARAIDAAEIAAVQEPAFETGIDDLVLDFVQPRPSWLEDWSELGRLLARGLYFWR